MSDFLDTIQADPSHVVDGVRFESVPQLCAAYELALAHLAAVVALIDPGAHAWHQDQRKVQDARAFLLAAGKDVP